MMRPYYGIEASENPRDPCAIMAPLRTLCYGSPLPNWKSYVVDEKASLKIQPFDFEETE